MSRKSSIIELRSRIRTLESGEERRDARLLALRWGGIAAHLADGGLTGGSLHLVEGSVQATARCFVLSLLHNLAGPVAWCGLADAQLHAAGLVYAGLAPERLMLVETMDCGAALKAAEDALREGMGAVVAESAPVNEAQGRRLQLAAKAGKGLGFLLPRQGTQQLSNVASFFATQWRVSPLPARHATSRDGPPERRLPPRRWRLELLRARGGRPGIWDVEVCDATGDFRLSASLGERTPGAATA